MFRTLMLFVMLAMSFSAVAQNANPCDNIPAVTKDMNTSQVATLLATCRGNTKSAPIANITPEDAGKWSGVAGEFAKAVGTAAKELGIAVNDFLDSPAGWILAILLVVNYGGSIIAGVLFGLPITVLCILFLYKFYRQHRTGETEYAYIPVLWGMFSVRRLVKYKRETFGEGDYFCTLVVGAGILLANIILWANIL